MRTWDLGVVLDAEAKTSLFRQISSSIVRGIQQKRLLPGDALPGSRALARTLGVHRNTVLASYAELTAEGWLGSEPSRGMFVSADLPGAPKAPAPHGRSLLAEPGFELAPALPCVSVPDHPRGTLVLWKGAPDVRLLPTADLARAYRRTLARYGAKLLQYGDRRGHVRLRTAIADMLARARGIAAVPDSVMITRGSQQAIDLAARALVRRGDKVAIEALGHPHVWDTFRQAGARLLAVPIDEHGMSVSALADMAKQQRIRAVYVTPHHQFPTTAVMPAARRAELLELASTHSIAVIEDDYDHEFHYDGRPILPMASADPAGVVLYIGTLSKIFAPGLRVGFVSAPLAVIERMSSLRASMDMQGDHVMECAVATLFEDGDMARHVRRMRRVYLARRDALVGALLGHLPGIVQFQPPAGGMALWVEVAARVDIDAWTTRGLGEGVAFRGATMYAFDGRPVPFMRLGFAALDAKELGEAVARMARALRTLRR